MTTDNWISLVAAIIVGGGTLFLGIMAWRTIHQTRSIQRAEKRERLLNEIIEWAINVIKWRSEHKETFKEVAGLTNTKKQDIFMYAHIVEVQESFMGMRGRNQYISTITRVFEQGLQDAVVKLIEHLEGHVELLGQWQRFKANAIAKNLIEDDEYIAKEGEYTVRADQQVSQIEKSANNVIEEASKIKTRDTG